MAQKKPKRKSYPPLAVRLKKAQAAKDAKAMRESAPQRRVEKAAAKVEREGQKADKTSGSFGAALDKFIGEHGADKDAIGDGEAQVVANFLRPYVENLKKLERHLPEFPDASDIPWCDVESAVLDPSDPRTVAKIATQFNIDRHRAYEMSKKRKWKERRAVLRQLRARKTTMKALAEPVQIISGNGKSIAATGQDAEEKQFVTLVENCISVFTEALNDGLVRFTSARDLDTLMRLMHFLKGKADKIAEQRHRVTPAQFREIVAEVVAQTRFSPRMAGVVLDADYEVIGDEDEAELEALPAPS